MESWLTTGKTSVFCAQGPPGVGKSVLASAVINDLCERMTAPNQAGMAQDPNGGKEQFQPFAVRFIYFVHDDQQHHGPIQVWARLLLPMYDRIPALRERLPHLKQEEVVTENNPSMSSRWEQTLESRLSAMLRDLSQTRVLVLDDVDEAPAETQWRVLSCLEEFSANDGPQVVVLCRPVVKKPRVRMWNFEVILSGKDIGSFVMQKLRNNPSVMGLMAHMLGKQQIQLLQELSDTIANRSSKM